MKEVSAKHVGGFLPKALGYQRELFSQPNTFMLSPSLSSH